MVDLPTVGNFLVFNFLIMICNKNNFSNGQLIQRVNIDRPQGTVNLNTTQWTAGIYFATLWSNGEAVKVYQIIIRR
jgi:hypothetical protein